MAVTTFNDDVKQAGIYLRRQLEQVIPRLYAKRDPDLWGADGSVFPVVADLEPGAKTVIEETILENGEAVVMSPGDSDLPTVEVSIDETPFKTYVIAASTKWTIHELLADQKAGRGLQTKRLEAMVRAIQQKVHKIALFGHLTGNANAGQGIYTLGNVTVNSSTYDGDNPATTADDHIAFIADNMNQVVTSTNKVEAIDTILIPCKLWNIWTKARIPNTSSSIINYILETYNPQNGSTLSRIMPTNESTASVLEEFGVKAGGTNEDRLIFFPASPDTVEMKMYPLRFLPIQQMGWSFIQYAYLGVSELIDHYPGGMLYVDIPTIV